MKLLILPTKIMRTVRISLVSGLLFAAMVSGLALEASAADVRVGLSARETYVGLPITLQIQVSNATDLDPPIIPEIDGLEIKSLGTPSRNTQIMTVNGKTTTNASVVFAYQLTPQRAGNFHIPAITVQADGREQQTRAIDFVVSKSETGDLLFAEIAGKENQIYVGQALDVTLKIWLRPYRDRERGITLSEADMWQMISERTTWGAFEERIQQLADERQRPAGKEVLRKDRAGVEHSYYLYEIPATIYPKRPGKIDANDVKVIVDYPTALGKSRDPFAGFFADMPGGPAGMFGDDDLLSSFGSRLTVQSVRPIVAEVKVDSIDVRPIPTADRPDDYRGAVGKYRIATEANPTNVKAGDPINLMIGIAGTGPMELVQSPPLAELPELTADFKVPDEPLAGFVKGDRKVFSTSIRPRKEGVAQIPAIPFSYFDPETQKFVTVRSKPISVHVEPADMLALDAVVGHEKSGAAGTKGKQERDEAKPSLEIFTGDDLLTNETPLAVTPWQTGLLLAVPPLVVLGILLQRSRQGFSLLANRFGSSMGQCQAAIEKAGQPADVVLALQTLLVKRFKLNSTIADNAVLVGALRSAGYRNLAIRCERILQACANPASNTLSGGLSLIHLKNDALQLIEDLQSQRRPSRGLPVSMKPRTSGLQSSAKAVTKAVAITFALAGATLATRSEAWAANGQLNSPSQVETGAVSPSPAQQELKPSLITLTTEQQRTLLTEANQCYKQAESMAAKDTTDAKQAFSDAAAKYQLLVDSGVRNHRLFINLGNAYLQSGQNGRAIANYRRSLQIAPANRESLANLAYAESLLVPQTAATNSNPESISISDFLSHANGWLARHISMHRVFMTMFFAWFVFWTALGLRLFDARIFWKTTASAAILVFAVATTSYALSCQEAAKSIAVIVSPDATLREGDGQNYPKAAEVSLGEGQTVELLRRRGEWLQIRTPTDRTGWLPRTAVETI